MVRNPIRTQSRWPSPSESIASKAGPGTRVESLWIKIESGPEEVPGFVAAARSIVAGFQRSAKSMTVELRTAQRLRVPVQPCLRDVWHDHVLFINDAVSGIVDPAAARTDTVAADISRLVGSLVGDDPHGWTVALEAYQSVRSLSPTNSPSSASLIAAGHSYRE